MALCVAPRIARLASQCRCYYRPDFKFGLYFGSIFPDADHLSMALCFVLEKLQDLEKPLKRPDDATQIDMSDGCLYHHRTATHSLLGIVVSTTIVLGLYLFSGKHKFFHNIWHFVVGNIIGNLTHSLMDMLYLGGVALFWPFIPTKYDHFNLLELTSLLPWQQNLVSATDPLTDVISFYLPVLIVAFRLGVNHKASNFFFKVAVVQTAVSVFFAIIGVIEVFDLVTFHLLLYSVGGAILFILLDVLAVLCLRDAIRTMTWDTLAWNPPPHVTLAHSHHHTHPYKLD